MLFLGFWLTSYVKLVVTDVTMRTPNAVGGQIFELVAAGTLQLQVNVRNKNYTQVFLLRN